MSFLSNGYGSVFIKVFYFKAGVNGKKDTFRPIREDYSVVNLEYKYSEDEDDEAIIKIECGDSTISDRPEFQKGATLKVLWGYIEGRQSKAMTVVIRDVDLDYDDKVSLTLTCTDRASLMKDSTSQKIHDAGTGQEEDEFTSIKIIADFCKKYGLTLHLLGDHPFGKVDFKVNPFEQYKLDNQSVDQETGAPRYKDKGYPFSVPKVVSIPGRDLPGDLVFALNRYRYYPQANKSDFQLVWELLKKEKNGPWIVSGRNDTLTVAQRNLAKKPSKLYIYKGGSGELLSCKVNDKGQLSESESENVSTFAWDGENKEFTFTNQSNENTSSTKTNEYTKGSVMEGLFNALLIRSGSNTAAKLISKLGSYTFKGLTALESIGLVVYQAGQNLVGHYINLESNTPKGRADAPNATKWERQQGQRNVQVRKIYLPSGGVINETAQPHIPESFQGDFTFDAFRDALFGPKYNELTYSVNTEETAKMREYIAKLKSSNLDYSKLPTEVARILKNVGGTSNRYSSESPEVAKAEAENLKKENELERIKITATALGDPNITDQQVITILGIGNLYSGNYYIKKCRHKVSPEAGYILDLEEVVSNSVGADDEKTNLTPNQELPGAINVMVADQEDTASDVKYVVTSDPSTPISHF